MRFDSEVESDALRDRYRRDDGTDFEPTKRFDFSYKTVVHESNSSLN